MCVESVFFRDCVKKPTNTFALNFNTFHTSVLPSVVEIGFISAKVDVCIRHPPRWYQCQVFGHNENKCGRHDKLYVLTAVCLSITQLASVKVLKCVNCSGDHPANSKQCTAWEKEKKILKIKCEQKILFPEARKQYEQFMIQEHMQVLLNQPLATNPHKKKKGGIITNYAKNHHQKKITQEKPKGKPEKSTSSPRPGPAQPATLEMMKKEEERKEKDRIKQQQKEEIRQQFAKEKQQNESKEKEQTEKAQQNPYSVLHKDNRKVCIEEMSVVFTGFSSSDHLPKGTLLRLPVA